MKIVGILLAAGFSRRFGDANKLSHILLDSRPVGLAAAENLVAAITDSIAVIRPNEHTLGELLTKAGLQVITCSEDQQNMSDSLVAAVKRTADMAVDGFVIALADMPFIRSTTISMVAQQLRDGADIMMPSYQGQRGHPVGFSSKFRNELESLHGDEGARSIVRQHAQQVSTFESDDPGILADIDTLADLKKYQP
ncbi:MAG TPA: nucleotidyltransferase family protein [Methylophilaceae bacterium]|nr:nucleotidyltransferase family protein [Methylophilaceae bacterium]